MRQAKIHLPLAAFFLFFLALLCSPATAQNIKADQFRLENGLDVVLVVNRRMPVVTQMLWYNAGAMNEAQGQFGAAHFLEHMMFKGTKSVPPGDFSAAIAEIGGQENAFTGQEYAAYYQQVGKEHLETILRLESDRMRNLQLDADLIEKERLVILEERHGRVGNDPIAQLQEQLLARLYPCHPYGRPVLGSADDIKAINATGLQDFYRRHYAPDNAVLVIAGDIDLFQTRLLIEQYYGPIEGGDFAPVIDTNCHASPGGDVVLRSPFARQPYFLRHYAVPGYYDADPKSLAYGLQLLDKILGDGRNSRLYQELVLRQKLASHAGSNYQPDRKAGGIFTVFAIPNPGIAQEKIQEAVDLELKKLAQEAVADKQLSLHKTSLSADFLYAQDGAFRLAYWIGASLIQGASLDDIRAWPDRIQRIKADDVKSAASVLIQSRRVQGWALPEEKKFETPSESQKENP